MEPGSHSTYQRLEEDARTGSTNQVAMPKTFDTTRSVGYLIANMIGCGMFLMPHLVYRNIGSFPMLIMIWFLSGMVVLGISMCYSEMALKYPFAVGEYTYLSTIHPKFYSFAYLWTQFIIIKPISLAIATSIFSQYLARAFIPNHEAPSTLLCITAIITILISACTASIKLKIPERKKFIQYTIKFCIIVVTITCGLKFLINDRSGVFRDGFSRVSSNISSYIICFFACLWTYEGWTLMCYKTLQMINPSRDLNRAFGISIFIVTAIYMLINLAFFAAIGDHGFKVSPTIALSVVLKSFPGFWWVLFLIVPYFLHQTCYKILYIDLRLMRLATNQHLLPEWFTLVHNTQNSPLIAIIFIATIATIYVFVTDSNVEMMLVMYGLTTCVTYLMTLLSLMKMKRTMIEPNNLLFEVHVALPSFLIALMLMVIGIVAFFPFFQPGSGFICTISFTIILSAITLYFGFIYKLRDHPSLFRRFSKKILIALATIFNLGSVHDTEGGRF